jgi:hypothetical protein
VTEKPTTESAEHPQLKDCLQPGCAKQLRSDNRSGYCQAHQSKVPHKVRAQHIRFLQKRGPRPTCKQPGCSKELNSANTIGYCRRHRRRRARPPQPCAFCGCEFLPTPGPGRRYYCSSKCSDRARYAKKKLDAQELTPPRLAAS